MPGQGSTKEVAEGAVPRLGRLKCGKSLCEKGLTGPFAMAQAKPFAAWWCVELGAGQRGSVGAGTEPESGGEIRLPAGSRRDELEPVVGRGSASPGA